MDMALLQDPPEAWDDRKVARAIADAEKRVAEAKRTEVVYLKTYEDEALEYLKNQGKYLGVSTGYTYLDWLLGSFVPGELFTIGGDTGHGKSLFAMNIAQNVYKLYSQPVLLVNLELTREQAIQRFYNLSGEDHDYAGIMVQASPAVTYKDIDKLMKKAKAEGACLVIIDHLHFFNNTFGDNQAQVLGQVMKHFKECAVENNLPVILLSHVTPTVKYDQHGDVSKIVHPDLHSFKGSRSIEQISDMVGFVFRDNEEPTRVEFYLRKNRSRPLYKDSIYFRQDGWTLTEDKLWVPQNYEPFGNSSEAVNFTLPTSDPTVTLPLPDVDMAA